MAQVATYNAKDWKHSDEVTYGGEMHMLHQQESRKSNNVPWLD